MIGKIAVDMTDFPDPKKIVPKVFQGINEGMTKSVQVVNASVHKNATFNDKTGKLRGTIDASAVTKAGNAWSTGVGDTFKMPWYWQIVEDGWAKTRRAKSDRGMIFFKEGKWIRKMTLGPIPAFKMFYKALVETNISVLQIISNAIALRLKQLK